MRSLFLSLCLLPLWSLAAQGTPAPGDSPRVSEQEEVPPADSTRVKETIVVTATRSAREVSELPVSTAVMTEEELKTVPATRVDDVLRSIPGVQLPTGTSNALFSTQSRLSMRGLGDVSALVLVDGVPLHDPFDGTILWGKVPMEDVRQIEVVRGASASLFGNYALGGAVHVLTRRVEDSRATLDVSYASAQTTRGTLTVDHMLGEGFGVRFSKTYGESDGFLKTLDPGAVDIRAWNNASITSARADWAASSDLNGFLKAGWSEVDVSNGTARSLSRKDSLDFAAGAQKTIGSNTLLSTTAFHQRSTEHLVLTSIIAPRASEWVTSDSEIPGRATGGSLEWSHQRTGSVPFLSLGIDVQRVDIDENRDTYNRSGVFVRRNVVNGTQVSAGLFGQASWRPVSRFELLTSVRVDHFRNTDGSDQIVGGITTTYPSKTVTELDPRVSARYELRQGFAARASVYRAFKAPSIRRLYRSSQFGSTLLIGNPDLEPEILTGAEVGLEWLVARTRFEVNVYRSEVDGYVTRVPAPGQAANVTQFRNLGRTRSDGIEATAETRLAPGFWIDAGYTYADSIITDDPNPAIEGRRIPDIALHTGTLTLRYQRNAGTSVQLRGRVLSGSYGDPENTELQPAYRVLDLAVNQPVRPWLDVYARVENLLDHEYYYVAASTRRPGQPRVITGGVRLRVPMGAGNVR